MGVETEYVVRCKPNPISAGSKLDFDRLVTRLGFETPTAPSFRNKYRVFLANGGCISVETGAAPTLKHALLEAATPECRSPRDLLCYQVAIEKLLSESVSSTFEEQDAQLLKGSADAFGHTYGQHESYEMRIAKGPMLVCWRVGLLFLLPCVIAYKLLAALWFLLFWLLSQAVGLARQPATALREFISARNSPKKANGRSVGIRPFGFPMRWIRLCAAGLRILHMPLSLLLWTNIYCFALRPHRRHVTAFLTSRCIVDGAGYLDKENRFWVSARASTVNSIIGFGSYGSASPIFRCDSWLRGLCVGPFWSFGNYLELFKARQRVEIAIGDSGLCEQSQYVRLGATALVLDLVEKTSPKVTLLKNPIEAINRFAKDWMLLTSVPDRSGRQWSSLDIQHSYAAAVRQMLQSKSSVPIEAWKILDQWQSTLNQLHPTDDESHLPRAMLGRIDWLSKLWLLHQTNSGATWQARKKIDLRYHELSCDGYHRRLSEMLELAPILHPMDVSRAKRTPPVGSPATQRAYLIREFSEPECDLHVDWTHAEYIFAGKKRRVKF